MRTLTADQTALLETKERAVHARIKVYSNGAWQDLHDLSGYDWLIKGSISRSVDSLCSVMKVSLGRKAFDLNLSPLMDGSKFNYSATLIDIALPIVLETATVPVDVEPIAADWQEIFRGVIDEVDFPGNTIEISARDQGGDIQDWFIETQQVYGSSGGVRLELVLQQILDDHNPFLDVISANFTWNATTTVTMSDTSEIAVGDYIGYAAAPLFKISAIVPNTSATITNPHAQTIPTGSGASTSVIIIGSNRRTIYVANGSASDPLYYNGGAWTDSPDWMVKAFKCPKVHLLEYLNELAQQIGWEMRYWWHSGEAAFELLFREPDRAKSTPDYTFDSSDYMQFTRLALTRASIRNHIRVTYGNADNRTSVTQYNTGSINKYGRRSMEIAEAASSAIDSSAEAYAMAAAALADLKEPTAELTVSMPFFWPAQLGDLYRFSANNDHFDNDQDLAVVSIEDNFGQFATTHLSVRGTPSGGGKRWLAIEARRGMAEGADLYSDGAAEGLTLEQGNGVLTVTYDDPRAMEPPISDWAYTRCYVHTSDPGDPPSSSYLKAVGRQTRFEIGGLDPGVTYYCRLDIVDASGNIAATTSVVSEAMRHTNPYDLNPDDGLRNMIPNAAFEVYTLGNASPPDQWTIGGLGSWGAANDVYFSTSEVRSTTRSLHFRATSTSSVKALSAFIPVVEGALYGIGVSYKAGLGNATMEVKWYKNDKSTSAGSSQLYIFMSTTGSWKLAKDLYGGTAPADARFAQIEISKPTGGTPYDLYIDSVTMMPVRDGCGMTGVGISVDPTTWTNLVTSGSSRSEGFDDTNDEFDVQYDGDYSFLVTMTANSPDSGSLLQTRVRKNGSSTILEGGPVLVDVDYPQVIIVGSASLIAGDSITVEGYHDSAGAESFTTEVFIRQEGDAAK